MRDIDQAHTPLPKKKGATADTVIIADHHQQVICSTYCFITDSLT